MVLEVLVKKVGERTRERQTIETLQLSVSLVTIT